MHEFAIESEKPNSSFNIIAKSSETFENESVTNKTLDELIQDRIKEQKRFYGIEISPAPRGQDLDYNKFISQPLFTSITWLFDNNLKQDSLSLAPAIQLGKLVEKCSPVLMHLTCYKLQEAKLRELLNSGITNILALKGDSSHMDDSQPWTYAIDLVQAIRQIDDNVTVAVAGYPEVHRLSKSRSDDLQRLKEKVDTGANFIITNTCFSFEHLAEFVRSCRSIGINVPIIPGIYVPSSYNELHKMCNISKVTVPHDQMEMYERYKDDGERFTSFAVDSAVNLVTELLSFEEHRIPGVHFFTLNKYDHIFKVVEKCDFDHK